MTNDIQQQRKRIEKRLMDEIATEKTWEVPAHSGKGPVTIAMRVPEVRVTDSDGREIVLSPKQAGLVGMKLGNIDDWLQHGEHDWTGDEDWTDD